jgi:hypothetical protein
MTPKSRGLIAINPRVKLKKKIYIRTQLLNVNNSGGRLEISISGENDAVSKRTIHHLLHSYWFNRKEKR